MSPICTVALVRGDREGTVVVDRDGAHVTVPGQAFTVPSDFLPEALARLNDLGPRPRVEDPSSLRLPAGTLATALAAGDAADANALEPAERARLHALIAARRGHWRAEVRWTPAPDAEGARAVEVLDTSGGVWLVVADGDDVELRPSTPTAVFRRLAALLPRDGELAAAGTVSPPS